ncbi:MAG: membrane protein insertion efficiency factor YidD [Ruminococcus sp.]|nr:membrane protein insertion efficiency factor YidD [Ruminococcus sp.]
MRYLAIALVRLYRKIISPLTGAHCRYYPTCSQYAIDAFKKHGFLKGGVLSAWRIMRCNPFSRGGVDYVPETFTLRTKREGR